MERKLATILLISLLVAGVELAFVPLKFEGTLRKVNGTLTVDASPVIWHDCSSGHSVMKLDTVDLDPNPPVKGEELHMKAQFEIFETITSGQVVLTVQKVGTPFDIKKTVDLCDLVKKVKMSCPLQKGTFHLDVSHKIPSFVPPGKYSGKAEVSVNGKPDVIACFQVDMQI